MRIKLYPRFAPVDPATKTAKLRVWLGVFDVKTAPVLTWTVDGEKRFAAEVRPLQSVRAGDLLTADTPRAFTGVFEFDAVDSGSTHRVGVTADDGAGGTATDLIQMSVLPAELPSGFDYFNVLLVSCFDSENDPKGLASSICRDQLKGTLQPHLTIMAGDQVYLDMPPIRNFPDDEKWLAAEFEGAYTHNWIDVNGYCGVLGLAPSVAIPDDHEYWNNYPNFSPPVQNSITEGGRERWRRAARAGFDAFQLNAPVAYGDPVIFDVPPLSFFIADTRSHKAEDLGVTMDDNTKNELKKWVDRVGESQSVGVFVSGQSLFASKARWVTGALTDYELPNYGDYAEIMQTLAELTKKKRPLICLTGDVHWGRVASATSTETHRPAVYEVISSPTSLVTFPGIDEIKEAYWKARSWTGVVQPWPRHSDAENAPKELAPEALPGLYTNGDTIWPQRGNQAVLLRFRQVNGGVGMNVRFYPLHGDPKFCDPVVLQEITLAGL